MSNLPQTIKSQLKGLKSVTLTDAEKQAQKNLLLAKIGVEQETLKKEFFIKEFFTVFIKDATLSMTWQSIGAMFLLFGVVIGPGVATVSASRGSLPGDTLYPIKRNIEKAKVSMRFSTKAKATLEIKHVENRVYELSRLTKEQTPGPERTQKVSIALTELKKDTTSVKERMEKLKETPEKDSPKKKAGKKKDAAQVAILVQEKTSEVQESIKVTVTDLATEGDNEAKSDIKEALDTVNEVAIDALEVIVDAHEEEGGEEIISEEDVKQLVKKQLENTKEIVEVLKEEIDPKKEELDQEDEDVVEDEPKDESEEQAEEDTEEVKEEAEEDETEEEVEEEQSEEEPSEEKKVVKKKLDEEIADDLEEIEQLIEMDNLSQAVDKLANTKQQVSEINKELRQQDEKEAEEDALEEQVEETHHGASEQEAEDVKEQPVAEEEEESSTEPKPLIDDIISE